jgi:hypothetical protein
MRRLMRLLILPAALGCGCTDGGLAEQGYRGDPLYEIQVYDPLAAFIGQPGVRVGVFWFARGLAGGEDAVVEQPGSRWIGEAAAFTLPLFAPPPEALVLATAQGGRLAAAGVVAYRDADGDGRRGDGEGLAGSVTGRAVLYLADDHDGARSPSGLPLSAGYHYVRAPMLCRELPATQPGDCGVPLSAPCETDADCRGGTCLKRLGAPIAGGACAIPEPPPDGCRPADGTLRVDPMPRGGPIAYYLRGCATDADCPGAGQACELDNRLCSVHAASSPLVEGQRVIKPCIGR